MGHTIALTAKAVYMYPSYKEEPPLYQRKKVISKDGQPFQVTVISNFFLL